MSSHDRKAMAYDFCVYFAVPAGILVAILGLLKNVLNGLMFESDPKHEKTPLALKIVVFIVCWLLTLGYLVAYVCLIYWKVRQNHLERQKEAADKVEAAKDRQFELEFLSERRSQWETERKGRKKLFNLIETVDEHGFKFKLDQDQMIRVQELADDIKTSLQKDKRDQDNKQEALLQSLNALTGSLNANTEALKNMAQKACQCETDPDTYLSGLTLLFE